MTYSGVPEPDKSKTACCAASRPPSDVVQADKPEWAKQTEKASMDGMVYLSGNTFLMGTDYAKGFPQDGEGPIRKVRLDGFWIDTCAVTNSQFEEFIEHTGYVTEAERYGWSFVFHLFLSPESEKRVKGVAGRLGGGVWRTLRGVIRRVGAPTSTGAWTTP